MDRDFPFSCHTCIVPLNSPSAHSLRPSTPQCLTREILRDFLGDMPSYPFDWVPCDTEALLDSFASDFAYVSDHHRKYNKHSNIFHTHDFKVAGEEQLDHDKYQRNSARLLDVLDRGIPVIFLRNPFDAAPVELENLRLLANLIAHKHPRACFRILLATPHSRVEGERTADSHSRRVACIPHANFIRGVFEE